VSQIILLRIQMSPFQNHPGGCASYLFLTAALVRLSLLSAQDVVLGTGNTCPDGRIKVICKDGCKKAKEAAPENIMNSKWRGTEKSKNWPSDCYFCDGVPGCTDGVWFNNHEEGKANGDAAPLCVLPTWDSGCDDDDDDGGVGGHVDFLFAGDSDISRWPDDKRNEVSTDSVNEGVGGWTCQTLRKEIPAMLEKYTPLWTVVVCGENDISNNGNVDKAFKNFQQVVKLIAESGSRVLYVGTKPEPLTQNLHSKYREYDQKIRDFANSISGLADKPPLVMVDSYKGFEDLGNPLSLYFWDRLHLSGEGYDYWTEWTSDAVDEADSGSLCTVWQSGECTQVENNLLL